MKLHFKLSDKEGLHRLQEDWLTSFCEFFKEKVLFKYSQTVFLALLDTHIIEPHKCTRVLLFADNIGKKSRVFKSSLSIGLLQGKSLSRIKHAPPITFVVQSGESLCVEFPLKGDNTPKGKYKIYVRVENCEEKVKYFAEKFSIYSISDFVSTFTSFGSVGGFLTSWALKKLGARRIRVSQADVLYLGTSSRAQLAAEGAGALIEDKIDIADEIHNMVNKDIWKTPIGTTLSGVTDGFLCEMLDTNSPCLTLTVV
jgi:hypothetical protein